MWSLSEVLTGPILQANYLSSTVRVGLSSRLSNSPQQNSHSAVFPYRSLPPELRAHVADYVLAGRHVYLPQIHEVAVSSCEPDRIPGRLGRIGCSIGFMWHIDVQYEPSRADRRPRLPYCLSIVNHVATGKSWSFRSSICPC